MGAFQNVLQEVFGIGLIFMIIELEQVEILRFLA